MPVGPVFIGGMQRSGNHALGQLVSQHSHYALVPEELVFHGAPPGEGGLPDLLSGRMNVDEFVHRMATYWWRRPAPWDAKLPERGVFMSVPEERFRPALERFAATYSRDSVGAVRALLEDLLDPIAQDAGARAWVEMSPTNLLAARQLNTSFPDMRLVHTIRDGRDVACSLLRLPWGDDKLRHALGRWERTLREGDSVVRDLPADRVHVLHLEDLVVNEREETYRQLLDFLEVEDEPQMREFFETQVTQQNAHLGRWHTELSGLQRAALTGRYVYSLAKLERAGVRDRPPLRALRSAAA